MSPRLLQRLVIVTTAFLFLAAAALFESPARGDDRAKAAQEAAVLDRIFANWHARHDRVRSFHFTYDCRTTYRRGQLDFSKDPRKKFDEDQAFDQFGIQLWVDEDRTCLLNTPSYKVPIARPTDTPRVIGRFVSVGDTSYSYYSGPRRDTGEPEGSPFALYGQLYPRVVPDAESVNRSFAAPGLTFRSRPPRPFWKREQCSLVDEKAVIDNGHFTKVRRALKEDLSEEAFWVSPVRGDVVVHWTTLQPGAKGEGSIKYIRDQRYGWIPSEWTCEHVGRTLEECKVTAYAINEKIDPAVFSLDFPPGTPVEDSLALKTQAQNQLAAEAIRHYVVQPDGTKRAISRDDFFKRLRNIKPQGK